MLCDRALPNGLLPKVNLGSSSVDETCSYIENTLQYTPFRSHFSGLGASIELKCLVR